MALKKQELDIIQKELALEAERLLLCKTMDELSQRVTNIYAQRKTTSLTPDEWGVVSEYWVQRSQYHGKLKGIRERFAALADERKAIHAKRDEHTTNTNIYV